MDFNWFWIDFKRFFDDISKFQNSNFQNFKISKCSEWSSDKWSSDKWSSDRVRDRDRDRDGAHGGKADLFF